MTEEEANQILDTANFLLMWFPHELPQYKAHKNFKRKPYFRAKFIDNRKVFFNIIQDKYRNLNKRDKARRYEIILHLREILGKEMPLKQGAIYTYKTIKNGQHFILVIKDIQRKKRKELYLFALYPIKK